nr:cytochrome c3 family protein [Thermoanaerobaculales bacterium]
MNTTPRPPIVAALVLAVAVACALPAVAQDVGVLLSPGPLSEAHAKLEGIKACESCHEPGKGVSTEKCLACHKPVAERMAARKGVHRDVTGDCAVCHAEHAGRDADIRPLDIDRFDHLEETGFPLDGMHAALASDCKRCHTTRSFLTVTPDCASCHKDPHGGALGVACASCHGTAAPFKETGRGFDHSTAAFRLDGAHAEVECAKCHTGGRFRGLAFAECSDCHRDPHGGALGTGCAGCHVSTTAFATTSVDHAATGFPLEGRHASVRCAECHGSGARSVRRPVHNRCADCHRDPHGGGFTEDCAACHTVAGFAGATLDHAARTDFALTGRHAEIPCVACHKTPTGQPGAGERTLDFRGLTTACADCHRDPHDGSLGTACASCHGTASFRVSTFEHSSSPEFFRGKHATAECSKCHTAVLDPNRPDSLVSSRTYRGLSTACSSCHTDPHLGQLGADCARCHTVDEVAFAAARFDHGATDFALTGRHAAVPCETCHKRETGDFPGGAGTAVRFTDMSDACVACHRDVHRGELGAACQSCHHTGSFALETYTHRGEAEFFMGEHEGVACERCHKALAEPPSDDPGHTIVFSDVDSGDCASCHADPHRGTLGGDCARCHTTFAPFANASRDFHKDTLLPLEGRHLAVPCADCHWNAQLEGTPTTCYDCHWIRRQDDRFHTALGVDCEQCHRPISWTAVSWDHGGATGVPLVGAHATVDCEACHVGGRFEGGTPTDCVACHLADYQGADDPNHVEAGFPTDCDLCHSPADGEWEGGDIDHGLFPLVGAHATLDCTECHSGGVFQGLPSDCVDCHSDRYQQAADPDHPAAGFGTDCETCHMASDPSWDDGRYPHSIYPLVAAHVEQPCNACH